MHTSIPATILLTDLGNISIGFTFMDSNVLYSKPGRQSLENHDQPDLRECLPDAIG